MARTQKVTTGSRKKPVPKTQKANNLEIDLDALMTVQKEATQTHKHSVKTRQDYHAAHERAIKWLREACLNASDGDDLKSHPDFALSFEGEPKECSGKALALYITFKCFHEGLGKSTGEVAYSALKKYWEEL
jgi:hypothetical protein